MAKQVAEVEIHASDPDLEDVDVSVDLIDDGLYLGNLACARDGKTLAKLQISHILTIDLVPLPRAILERPNLIFNYIKLADVNKEDLISHLPETNNFIKQAIREGGSILVHCYYGVSRSAAVVIAYIMEKYGLCYEEAYNLVKSKRRFISPNIGFVAQLKLFGHMEYKLNKDDPRFKQFRLKMAGQKFKQVKILPQQFLELVKADPGLAVERPAPQVYRCARCRRVLATHLNLIPHLPKQVKVELTKKGMRPPPSNQPALADGELLVQKLQALATHLQQASTSHQSQDGEEQPLDGYTEENLVDPHITSGPEWCRLMWFVEPLAWMRGVAANSGGKLHCPKCHQKVGSFSWTMGCRCPCGQRVAPAFYLVPSKVEWSNIVQNVQVTV